MAHVISFETSRFDTSGEAPNPYNEIFGESPLSWLREKLITLGWSVTAPAPEDWGWYMDVRDEASLYLVGASSDDAYAASPRTWIVQIHKEHGNRQRKRLKMADDDPLSRLIESLLRKEADFHSIALKREG
jgi:hypothetical protein